MLSTTEFITTKSFKLAIYKKGSAEAAKLALVLPGKLDTKDYDHMRSHVDFLADKGYLAVSFDPPGTWESEGDISLYNMTNYLKAINEIIEYYKNKPTFVMGHSRGGSMAMLAGTKNKYVTHFASIMSHPTFDPITERQSHNTKRETSGYEEHRRDTPPGYAEKNKLFRLPYSSLEDEIKYDMLADLSKCTKPKLFIAGLRDTAIKPEIVEHAYDISAKPKYIYMLDSDHDYRKHKKLIDEVNIVIGKFIAEKK